MSTIHATASRQCLDDKIAHGPEHFRPIMRAVRDHGCAFAIVTQGHHRFDIPGDRPSIVVIGDDMHEAHGPDGFHRKSLRRLLARCRGVVIVSAEPMVAAYASAAATAVGLGATAVIVETRIEQEAAWMAFVQAVNPNVPMLLSTVKPAGGVH